MEEYIKEVITTNDNKGDLPSRSRLCSIENLKFIQSYCKKNAIFVFIYSEKLIWQKKQN
ncbi:MAG: hypothetical protein LBO69_01890 [Ignavibacteria bacterium]|nr:hypothetical protein [Ignavibacteria bacterium]